MFFTVLPWLPLRFLIERHQVLHPSIEPKHNKLQTYPSVPCFALDECHATALALGSAEYFKA
jgi:hypothetical protein